MHGAPTLAPIAKLSAVLATIGCQLFGRTAGVQLIKDALDV